MHPEIQRRRTFAIISHPDAGKTTLTEKLLMFSGAIQIAGSVKGRKASRHAASDWMEIEKQRGISVASSVMQTEYRDCVINLLDTPGHQDFSEDTYRVLTAVDAALMVIDAGNGVEPQTIRLLQVCRARNTPIITFINKLDREVREPLDLLAEIEEHLGMDAIPLTWPVGMGKNFAGVVHLDSQQLHLFEAGADRLDKIQEKVCAVDDPLVIDTYGSELHKAQQEIDLIQEAIPSFDKERFLNGQQTPVFFGSAINNFGVKEVLDALVDIAPSPQPRKAMERVVQPDENKCTGVVFKVQANMDPSHRDRVAFIRICSGRFQQGMRWKIVRTGKEFKPNNVVTFLSKRRDILEEAYAGDIVGIPNHGVLQLGDVLTEGENLQFTGLPFFAPELFQAVEIADPMQAKRLQNALKQLGEEGAIQVFRPDHGGAMLLGAIGQLQFEVVAHRLETEYQAKVRLSGTRYQMARWFSSSDKQQLQKFLSTQAAHLARDVVDAPAILLTSAAQLRVLEESYPAIQFHTLREYSAAI